MIQERIDFKRLTPDDYPACKPYFADQDYELCMYSLKSLIVWSNLLFKPYYAVVDEFFVVHIRFDETKYPERNHLILPLSSRGDISPEKLHDIALKANESRCCFVPEAYIEKFGVERIESLFSILKRSGYDDYVYRTEDLAGLKGNKYSKKRNLINQFRKQYLNSGRVNIEPIRESAAEECIDFLEAWCEERDCDLNPEEALACEKEAVINAFHQFDRLEFRGLILRIDGKVCAFAMASPLTGNMGVLHFEKAFAAYKGLYQYFDRECAGRLFEGMTYINKENDMEIPGLVKAKKSYYPYKMVNSFELRVKEAHGSPVFSSGSGESDAVAEE